MRALVFVLLLGCTAEDKPSKTQAAKPEVDRSAADLAKGQTTELDTVSPAFGDGVLAELMGDPKVARAAFDQILASSDTEAHVAARAALHLAQINSREGKRREALDLVTRAEAFAPNDATIVRGAKFLRSALVADAGTGEINPRPGTALPNVDAKTAEAFAEAEKRLEPVHRLKMKPEYTALYTDLLRREAATDNLVAKYRAIAEKGGSAEVAARFRMGSLLHDFATQLFEVKIPQELGSEEQEAAKKRYAFRAWKNLASAAAEYRACLAIPPTPEAELWRLAAETELRRATALLDARGK